MKLRSRSLRVLIITEVGTVKFGEMVVDGRSISLIDTAHYIFQYWRLEG